jgi:ABC-2 type transport system permease protein
MNAWYVAQSTLRDLLRSKLLWNVPLLGSLMALVTMVAKEFTYGAPERIATNLGMGAFTVSAYGIAFFAGVMLIREEAESRTIYLIISRPISRVVFLLGKLAGVSAFLTLNLSGLILVYCFITYFAGSGLSLAMTVATVFTLLEAIMLLVVVVVLSLVANTALTLMFGLLLLVGGHAIASTLEILWLKQFPLLVTALEYYHWLLPGFYKINFRPWAYHAHVFPWADIGWAAGYWLFYTAALLGVGCVVIRDKDFD